MKFRPMLWTLATIALIACSEDPTQPDPPELSAFDKASLEYLGSTLDVETGGRSLDAVAHGLNPGHVPIAVGNGWRYRRLTGLEILIEGEEDSTEMIRARVKVDMTETQELFGREYVAAREEIDEGEEHDISVRWTRYRQDRDGLYEADISAETSAQNGAARQLSALRSRATESSRAAAIARAAEDVERKLRFVRAFGDANKELFDNEIQRFAYPLFPGQTWTIREDPSFTSRVVSVRRLRMPAGRFIAWSIRIDSELFGPNDRAYLFVGRAGILGHSFRTEGSVYDETGAEIGRIRVREREALVGYRLVER